MAAADLIAHLAGVVAPVFLVSAVGYAWARLGRPFDQAFVTNVVTLVGAPCLVFATLVKVRLSAGEMAVMGGATAACLLLFAVVGAAALRLARLKQRVYLPSLVFPNIGNMGLPVCLFAFGEHGLGLAMIYFTVCTLLQFCFGPAIAAGRLRLDLVARTPFLYAAVLALGVGGAGVEPPEWLMRTVELVGDVTIPLMLMALGAALAQFRVGGWGRQLVLSAGRLLLGAAGGWVVAVALGLDGAARGVLVIQSAMPVAVFNYLFASLYGEQPEESGRSGAAVHHLVVP
ncbi:MAG: AEC family transporter [Magnetospirillum sp.]|nr:AEC family transporter [Magnetospirillum sp.]